MTSALYLAAFLLVAIGFAHSILGEKYILIRLFRRDDLPKLFNGTEFTVRTLRFAWHLTTIAWWGFAAILFHLAKGPLSHHTILFTIGLTFGIHGLVILFVSRAKHFAWPVFLFVASIALYAAAT